jgi:hypothetical protein
MTQLDVLKGEWRYLGPTNTYLEGTSFVSPRQIGLEDEDKTEDETAEL